MTTTNAQCTYPRDSDEIRGPAFYLIIIITSHMDLYHNEVHVICDQIKCLQINSDMYRWGHDPSLKGREPCRPSRALNSFSVRGNLQNSCMFAFSRSKILGYQHVAMCGAQTHLNALAHTCCTHPRSVCCASFDSSNRGKWHDELDLLTKFVS